MDIRTHVRPYKSIYYSVVYIMLSGLFIITACSALDTSSKNSAQQFVVDTGNREQGLVLRLLTQDRKAKIEIFDRQFADGKNILEAVVYELRFNKWKQISMGQSPYMSNDPVRLSGGGQFGIIEVNDPNIICVDYETQKQNIPLTIIQVKSRRFAVYQCVPGNKEYFQIRGISKDGETIWQLFPDGYWQDSISTLTKEEAISKAQNILTNLSLKSTELKKAEISKDPVTGKEYWDIQFEDVSVDIDPESRNVVGISVKTLSKGKFIITERAEAEKAARELYLKLQAPDDFKLIDIKQGNGGDFWSTVWEKEVMPGVYSKYESVNLLLASDTGRLRIYRLFNSPPKSLEVKVSKDQAVATARTIAETKGFKNCLDATLDVEQANDYWTGQGSLKRDGDCTLVWVVTFEDSAYNRAKFYVDTLTGLVVGGDQTK